MQKKLNTKIAIVINIFENNKNTKKLLEKLDKYDVSIYCYDCRELADYPVFFINSIINVEDNIIACDQLAVNKCKKFKKQYYYLNINNEAEIEKIGT